jgi:hypothetical protein
MSDQYLTKAYRCFEVDGADDWIVDYGLVWYDIYDI